MSSPPPSPSPSRIPRLVSTPTPSTPSKPTPETSQTTSSPIVSHTYPYALSQPPISFPSPSSSSRSPRSPRPKYTRPDSAVYTSFPIRPPATPAQEEGAGGIWKGWGIWRDLESGGKGERERLLGERNEAREEGLPKVSRECLVAEIKCYGTYMLPPILVFGVLAIVVGLGLYWRHRT